MIEAVKRYWEIIVKCWIKENHEVDNIGEDGYGYCLRCGGFIKVYEY